MNAVHCDCLFACCTRATCPDICSQWPARAFRTVSLRRLGTEVLLGSARRRSGEVHIFMLVCFAYSGRRVIISPPQISQKRSVTLLCSLFLRHLVRCVWCARHFYRNFNRSGHRFLRLRPSWLVGSVLRCVVCCSVLWFLCLPATSVLLL